MSILYLIRHGQASFHSADYDALSDLGRRQSAVLGDYFSRVGVRFDAVFSGAKKRQIDTAQIVMERLGMDGGPRVLPEFNEHDTFRIVASQVPALVESDPQMKDDVERFYKDPAAFRRVFKKTMLGWMSGDRNVDGIESYADFLARVNSGIARAMAGRERTERVAVFSSGGPISAALMLALGVTDETSLDLDLQIHNASVSTFKAAENRLVLTSFNSAAHLETAGAGGLLTYL